MKITKNVRERDEDGWEGRRKGSETFESIKNTRREEGDGVVVKSEERELIDKRGN